MPNQELLRIVDGIARDKNIERDQIYTDIEQAIAALKSFVADTARVQAGAGNGGRRRRHERDGRRYSAVGGGS